MKKRGKLPAAALTVLLLTGLALWLWRTGFFQAVGDPGAMENYIERFSPYSQLVFFLLQLSSVILAPIPSNVTAMVGGMLFGTWVAFLLTALAVFLGSAVVFLLARSLGGEFAGRLVEEKVSAKYLELFRTKRDVFLALALLFPFFPDDLLCILAGLTDMPLGRYLVIVALTRPWGLLAACLLGGSALAIPWPAMVGLGVGGLALLALGLKYGDKVEEKLLSRLRRGDR